MSRRGIQTDELAGSCRLPSGVEDAQALHRVLHVHRRTAAAPER
jgi:hypothetical protein